MKTKYITSICLMFQVSSAILYSYCAHVCPWQIFGKFGSSIVSGLHVYWLQLMLSNLYYIYEPFSNSIYIYCHTVVDVKSWKYSEVVTFIGILVILRPCSACNCWCHNVILKCIKQSDYKLKIWSKHWAKQLPAECLYLTYGQQLNCYRQPF